MESTITKDFELPREITKDDNFFMVNYRVLKEGKEIAIGDAGVIDPEMNEEEFISSIKNDLKSTLDNIEIKIIYTIHFINEEEYRKYKLNNQ